jgi:hypothetical protein
MYINELYNVTFYPVIELVFTDNIQLQRLQLDLKL